MHADPVLKEKIAKILRTEFPEDTIEVTDGYQDNVHVIVVSKKFDEYKYETDRQDYIWTLINKGGLSDQELDKISLIIPFSPTQLKR